MTTFQAVILGIVQGVAEFLPISSSGHLVVLQQVFGIEEHSFTFDIVVHIGTLVAIVIVFWQDIWSIIKKPFSRLTGLLVVASLPAVVAGLFFRNVIENFRGGLWLGVAFIVTGFLLLMADRFPEGDKESNDDITYLDALIVGVMQALALPPGISRSGTTITGALGRGLKRATAARFSFLMAMIAIAGAGLLETIQVLTGDEVYTTVGPLPMFFGFMASLLVGYLSIRLLLKLIKSCKLRYFSYYVWALAAFILLDTFVLNIFWTR